jgi:RHS repeat-associated protein
MRRGGCGWRVRVFGGVRALASGRGRPRDRFGVWLLLALALCGASSAVAAQSGGAGGAGGSDPQLEAAMDKAEQQEQAEAHLRTSAAGQKEREQSQTEYRDLSDDAAVAAFEEHFPKLANAKPVEPLADAAGAHEVEFLDDHSAVVTEERGQPGQLVTTVGFPMRARGRDGLLRPVDLEVVPDGDAFSPTSPAVSTELGERADDGARVGPVDVDVVAVESSAGVASGGQVRYPNVDVDSDLVIATQPHGVETYSVLRSPDSPEVERLRLGVPADARISETSDGGAEVKVADKTVASVSAPRALDAQGADVPSKLVVDGTELVITTLHRDRDVAYPVLVDPVISYWTNDAKGSHYAGWQTTATQGGFSFPTWSSFGEGRYIDASPTIYYLNAFGHWYIDAQGESFFAQADFYNVSLDYNNPGNNYDWFDLTAGIWSKPAGRWVAVNGWSSEQTVPYSPVIANPSNPNAPDYRTGDQIRFALTATAQFGRQYWTRGYLGGAALWQEDHNVPSVTNAPPSTAVPRWSETSPSITVDGYDAGLGLKWFGVYGPGFEAVYDTGCTGNAQQACPMTKTGVRFPDDLSLSNGEKAEWTNANWTEGIHRLGAHVTDIVGRQSPDTYWRVGIDRDKPTLELSGSLNQGGEPLTGGSHTLKINATDGDRSTEALKRSGVKSIAVDTRQVKAAGDPAFVAQTAWTNRFSASQACGDVDGSCPMERDWEVRPETYAPGEYEVRVTATDQLDHPATKTFAMVIPPHTLAGASADFLGLEQWWTYDSTDTGAGTQAHVNLANGNLVWHSMPVVNAGRGLSTMVNLTYNSLQREPSPLLETPLESLEPYSETGFGFSMGISSLTRLNERLNVDMAGRGRITLTDADGTRHHFSGHVGNEVFTAPPGVQLHLRRFAKAKPVSPAAIGYQELEDNDKAWAATRPDGVTYFFDRRGYQTMVQDRNNNALRFTYEYRGPTRAACDAAASSSIFVMPNRLCPRKLVKVTDAGGRDVKLTYEPRAIADLPAQLKVDGSVPATCTNGTTETASCASGRLKSITDHLDRFTEFSYDASGYLTTLVQAKQTAAERQFDFGYDATAHSPTALRGMTEITEPGRDGTSRLKTRISYEPSELLDAGLVFKRRVKSLFDRGEQGASASRQFAYDSPSAGRTTVTDANGKQTEYALDARGRLTSRLDPADQQGRRATTTIGWDDATTNDNNVAEMTRAAGTSEEAVERMTYHANGGLLSRTDFPNGAARTTTLTYQDSAGAPEYVSGRPGNDAGGFVSDLDTIVRPEGGKTDFDYGPGGADVDPEHRGNVTERIDAEGESVLMAYDGYGQLLTEQDEIRNPTTKYRDYDLNGMPRTVEDPRAGVWRYCYDAAGRMTRSTDSRATGHDCASGADQSYSTRLTYDALDRVTNEVVPKRSSAGQFISRSYGYDDNDNLVSATDGENRTETRAYTAMDEVDTVSLPPSDHAGETGAVAEVTDLDYDAEGNVTRVRSPRGKLAGDGFKTEYRYDAIDRRIAEVRFGDPTKPEDVPRETAYAYDLRGNLVGVADPRHTAAAGGLAEEDALTETSRRLTLGYDRADRRTSEVEDPGAGGLNLTTTYEFDGNDNLVSETNPRGKQTQYTYDDRDRLTDVTDPTQARTHYELRPNGQVASVTTPRGTASATASDFTTTYGFNANNELISRSLPQAPDQYGGVNRSVEYTLNAIGDPITITDARGNAFTNTFLDSGQLRTTQRPSWWTIDRGAVRERTAAEHLGSAAGRLPESEGHGDYGRVDGQQLPELLPRAGSTVLKYDNALRIVGVIDAADGPGDCTDADDRARLEYDPLGRLTRIRQLRQRASTSCATTGHAYIEQTFGYDRNGNVARSVDPRSNVTTNVYNGFDELRKESAPGNGGADAVTEFVYDINGNMTDRVTPRGTNFRWQMGYDAADRRTFVENPADEKTAYTFDANGNVETKTTPRLNVWTYAYSDRDELLTTTAPDAGQSPAPDAESPSGRQTTYRYDVNGNQISISRPGADSGRIVTTREFDGRDLPWTQTVGNRTTVTEYDPHGNLRRVVNPPGVGGDDRPLNAWNGTPPTRAAAAEDGGASVAAENATVYTYSSDDLPTAIHLPFGDPDGTGGAPSDQDRWRQDFGYDERGRVRTVDAPYLWRVDCDPDAVPPSQGCTARTTYGHLDADWPSSQSEPAWQDPDSSATGTPALTYSYNEAGLQTGWATAAGSDQRRIVNRTYWPDGSLESRTAKETGADPAPQRTFNYAYNLNGSLTRITDVRSGGDRVTRISRDAAERQTLVNEMWANSKDTVLTYDKDGNVLTRRTDGAVDAAVDPAQPDPATYKNGKTTSFDYDPLGRERHTWVCTTSPTASCAAGGAQRTTSSDYYDGDFLASRTKPGGIVETRSYNDRGKLTNLTRKKGTTVQKNRSYSYDRNDNRTTDERGTHLFNARSQLIKWTRTNQTVVDYTLNGAGAVTKRQDGPLTLSYCFAGDRVTSAWLGSACQSGTRAAKYNYDAFGFSNVEKIEEYVGGLPTRTTTYSYDAFGRMKTAEGPTTGTADDGTFVFDALDRRDAKTVNGRTLDHSYVGLTESLSREKRSDDRTSTYDYDSSLQRLGQSTKANSTAAEDYRGYGTDANGSVEQLEKLDGTLSANESYSYDAYGHQEIAETSLSPQAQGNPFRFQGFYYDGEIETYDMQARPYRPDLGRFLTQDRYEDALGDLTLQSDPITNDRYAFVGGNPVSNIEFDGHRVDNSPGQTPPGEKTVGGGGGSAARAENEARGEFARTGRTAIDRETGNSTAQRTEFALQQAECETRTGIRQCNLGVNPLQVAIHALVQNPPSSAGEIVSTLQGLGCIADTSFTAKGFDACSLSRSITPDKQYFDTARQAGDETATIASVAALPYAFAAGGRSLLLSGPTRSASAVSGPVAGGVVPTRQAAKGGRSAADDVVAAACSFSGGTLVLMADGTKKPIDQIKVGDKVIATDPKTGERSARTVTHVWLHQDQLAKLVLAGETLTTTEDHPFWNATDRAWERADALAVGDSVLTADGRLAEVIRFDASTSSTGTAYNLTVAGLHTYHVGLGAVLVHNTCGRGLWRITKEGTEARKFHPTFGTFSKSRSDGLWWTRDRAGHASTWKVYEETDTGLRWRADADEYGDFLTGKHKGDVGRFIPWKDLAGR